MKGVSVLILTLNEESNISDCIDSCVGCDDIVVFDSMSTDRTVDIASAKGARIARRTFDNYAAQRNAALTEVRYRNPWLLMVDADERVTAELAAEIARAVRDANADTVMFRMRRKDFFMGRWLRRSSGYPTWFGRLMRPGSVRVERAVNEEYVAEGAIGDLRAHLHHHPFNKGIAWWFERHNRYSSMEADAKLGQYAQHLQLRSLLAADPVKRRRALKQLGYRLPMRPMLVFLYLYVVRMGMLDGRAGFDFSRMRAAYEMFIDLKVTEMRRRRRGLAL